MLADEIKQQLAGTIRTVIKNGTTELYKDGVCIKVTPTPKSQIRPPRESCLYKPGEPEDSEGNDIRATVKRRITRNANPELTKRYQDLVSGYKK